MVEELFCKELGKSVAELEQEGAKKLQIEEALRDIEGRHRALLEITTDGILLHDKGVLIESNPALAKMFNYKDRELKGQNVIDSLVLPEYRDLIREKMLSRFEGPYEIMAKRKNGITFPVMIVAAREVGYKNRIIRLVVMRDITKKKKTGRTLQRSEAFLKAIIENIPDMIFVKDTRDFRFVLFNKAGEDLLGYQKEELVGKTDYDFFLKHEADFSRKKDQEVLESGSPNVIFDETIQTRYKGSRCLTTKKIPIIYKGGKPRYLLGISKDVTDWKRAREEKRNLEQQLQQAHKMEAIGTLAGGIAHDFNNILSPIMIHSEMVMMELPSGSSLQQNMKQIFKAGERASDLVKQILTFARRKEKERIPLRVSQILKEAIKLLRSTLPTTIDIQYDINSEQDTVLGDPTQLSQIIMNLCTNAAHAMEEKGGTLEVILTNENLDSESADEFVDLEPGRYVKLFVRDTGHGITPEIMDRIFEPYYTTKAVGKGTGMGLALVHGIVKSYGGAVAVHSEVGKGASFHVYLPLVEGDTDIFETAKDSVQLPTGTERILFVDDEKDVVGAIQPMLEIIGYKVTAKTSSIEALEVFRNKPDAFDLVITDMTMPNMTGKELARELMSIRSDIPIILCTGFSEQIDEVKAKEMGISAFLMKPIVMHEITPIIRKILEQRT